MAAFSDATVGRKRYASMLVLMLATPRAMTTRPIARPGAVLVS